LLASDDVDTEYVKRDGILHIPRLIEATALNGDIYRQEMPQQVVERPWADDIPLQLIIGSPVLLKRCTLYTAMK
jgi:hypothetical protein